MTIEEIIKEAFSRGWNASHECATGFDYENSRNDCLTSLNEEVEKLNKPAVSKCAEPVSGRLLINFNNKLSRYQDALPKDIIIQWNELFEKLINNC